MPTDDELVLDFMENPNLKWMRTRGSPMFENLNIGYIWDIHGYTKILDNLIKMDDLQLAL